MRQVVLGVFTTRPHHLSGGQGTWLGYRQRLCAAAAAGPLPVARVVGFPSIFAWKSVSAEFRGYAPAKLASAFLFEVAFFATREGK